MMNESENKNNSKQEKQITDDVRGRVHNSQNPAFEQDNARHDISSVDQQEGNMSNGEAGGNFNADKSDA